jgi:CBS domain-containing protein
MNVADIMTSASVTDRPGETLQSAANRMWQQQTGSLLIMEDDELVGIITERDLMRAVARGHDVGATTVAEMMSKDVVKVESQTTLHEAARLMAALWIRHLPVVDDGKLLGVVSQRDLVGVLAALDPEPRGIELASDELVRARRLVRIEQGDLD